MATDSVMGIFADPQQIQQAQRQQFTQTAADLSQMDPSRLATFYAMQGGYGLGNAIGTALGAEDPQLKMATARRQILQGVNPQDMKSIESAAIQFSRMGDGAGVQAMQDLALKQSQVIRNTKEARQAANKVVEANGRQYLVDSTTGEKIADLGAASDKSTKVNLSVNADQSYGTSFGKGIAENDLALRAVATNAPEALTTIQSTRKLLDSGKVFVGMGANAKLNAAALGQAFGVTGQNENEIIANTQQLQQQRSQAVLNQVKTSGLGTGQGFTDKDLKFLQESAAGSITMSPDTIRRQLDVEERAIRAMSGKWNNRLKTLPEPLKASMGLAGVELPTTLVAPAAQIPTTGGPTGNPLVDKYLVKPQGQ